MEDKRAVTIISMSHNKDRAEVVVKTTLANGKMKSVTRHINRKPDGTWQGIVSSDRVVRNHA
ncbi:MAG: hypothetical protein HYY60_02830, partial [Parcubacteria group bacterium]|nr:hypothetical protein [Parcubacteria group bacterium]